MTRRQLWFTQHVTAHPLRIELNLTGQVHEYDDATGAFQASLGDRHLGMLARRPRSDQPWDLNWREVQHRWNTSKWDWALTLYDDTPTPESVEAIKQQLNDDR